MGGKLTWDYLRQRQSLPLEAKEAKTEIKIREWYEHFNGEVYVSFSGGKDSTVLLHQVRKLYPDVPAVFADTGLEYPEIKEFVKTIDNVVTLRPKMNFSDVIKNYGYPVVSKQISRFLRDLQNPTTKNEATRNLRLTGLNRKGVMCPSQKLSKKWRYLVEAPFKCSERCCDIIKKEPFHRYTKTTKKYPMIGVMAGESRMRTKMYLINGCNVFNSKTNNMSMPIAFWTEQDIWEYIKKYNIPYSSIYDMGERRTGCMFCMFGVHLEEEPNRFQRMKLSHPKQYNYCMENLGLKTCLDYIGVSY